MDTARPRPLPACRVLKTADTSTDAGRSPLAAPAAAHSPTARMFSRTPAKAPLRSCFRTSAGSPPARAPHRSASTWQAAGPAGRSTASLRARWARLEHRPRKQLRVGRPCSKLGLRG